ncbi:hypothetical protein ACLQ2N_23040 [Streptomyces sp. DT224]|uniref:hypothetical protein n=1 Tax=Streptomyces sp. DT224 TaxID=3393426 RepID=UPI003CF7F9C6
MGIESDQLVYDYLSRVGDLAQRQQLPSGARMRLVAELRTEIDRRRTAQRAHTPGQVRRIIGTLGTPDELVAAAARARASEPPEPPEIPEPRRARLPGGGRRGADADAGATGPRRVNPDPAPRGPGADASASREADPDAAAPGRADEDASAARRAGKGALFRRRADRDAEAPDVSVPSQADPDASAPHRLGMDEAGPDTGDGDWWRDEPGPFGETGPGAFGEFGPGTEVPGFRGGVEIPALLRPPEAEEEPEEEAEAEDEAPEEAEPEAQAPPEKARRRFRRARRPAPAAPEAAPRRGFGHPVLLLAAALLVVGAVMGSLLALAGGWLLAYSSRTLSRAEAKWAAMGLPGAVAAAALVWLWGRMDGRWGAPIPEHGMRDALGDVWPVTVRTAAVASALFLVWRARRR